MIECYKLMQMLHETTMAQYIVDKGKIRKSQADFEVSGNWNHGDTNVAGGVKQWKLATRG